MNNNQDSFNNNPQIPNMMNNQNPNTFINNPTAFSQPQPISVVPQNLEQNIQNNSNQGFNTQPNQPTSGNTFINNNAFNPTPIPNGLVGEDDSINIQSTNRFINNDINTTNTALNELNVDGEYNDMPKIDYSKDPKVQNNLIQEEKQKKTIAITGEVKVFIVIIIALLLFIFVMPYIFDMLRNIQY